jgi:trimeric autotransporter adhesin
MTTTSRRARAITPRIGRWLVAGAIAILATLGSAQSAGAQATPEGTVITNTATASYTDANGNTYTAATASVSVTVGFLASLDVTSAASVSPASPSTANTIAFTINNAGNGTDSIGTVNVTAAAGLTITGYSIGASSYATLAALQTALNNLGIAAGGNAIVTVTYNVATGQGGATLPVTLTATSIRTPATTDASTTNVTPATNRGVVTTPDAATLDRLPSNGTNYTYAFSVQNTGNASDIFNLAASTPGTFITIVSVNGTAGASSSVTIAAGVTATVNVVYSIANVAAGSTEALTLTATSQNDAAATNAGDVTVRVVKAALTMAKVAYRDNQTTVINNTTDRVVPGEYIQYRISVTNGGLASATSVSITDALPAAVTYASASGDVGADWSISESLGTVTANLTPVLAAAGSRFIWIRVRVK